MAKSAFIVGKLNHQQFAPFPVGYGSWDDAFNAVKQDYQQNRPPEAPDENFRVYTADDDGRKMTMVEVTYGTKAPLLAVAVYKILEGEWANAN